MTDITSHCGFGSAPIGDLRRAPDDAAVEALLAAAWDAGLRYFDTAPFYGSGLSERRLGDFLRDKPSESFTLSTKVGRMLVPDPAYALARWESPRALPFRAVFDYSYDGVMRSFEQSLQRLGLARIDTLLLHDIGRQTHGDAHPQVMETVLKGGVRALERLRDEKLVQSIGIGVNEWQVCVEILERVQLDTLLLAGRYTLLDQSAQQILLPICRARGIRVVAGSVFHRGILATGAVAGAMEYGRPAESATLARTARIETICAAFGVPLPAAALAFPLRDPSVERVIPGFSSLAELHANLCHLATEVPPGLWEALAAANLID